METLKNYVNWKLAHSDKVANAEGYPLIMENCKTNKRMKQLQVYGDCFQRLGSKNLLPYPYYRTTATINGVTFTDNGDGSITINGTATSNAAFYLYMNNTTLIPGTKRGDTITGSIFSDKEWNASVEKLYVVLNYINSSGTMKSGSTLSSSNKTKTFTINDDWYGIGFYILVSKGGVVDNITLRVQIELGKTATEYEPYILSPSPDCPSEIETVGDLTTKNLFDMETILPEQGWVKQSDGSYYVALASTPRNQILWDNTENYTGQLKILYQFKYLKGSSESLVGSLLQIKYTDGTTQNVYLHTGRFDADIWYRPTDSRTITDSSKTVSQIIWSYGTGGNSTWVKDIIITKDINTTEYEPYHKYKIPITARGKNLLPYPYVSTTKTINGVTFTDNGDGSISINGTATANAIFYLVVSQNNYTLDKCGLKIGDSYTISKTLISGDSMANVYFTANYYNENGNMKAGASISNTNTATATIQSDFVMWGIYLLVLKNKTVNHTTIKLQLERGTSATEYEPYIEPIAQNIYLDEPLRKVGDYADYIDFKNQKIVRNIKEEDISCQLPKTLAKTAIIEVGTSLEPSNIKGKYIIK